MINQNPCKIEPYYKRFNKLQTKHTKENDQTNNNWSRKGAKEAQSV